MSSDTKAELASEITDYIWYKIMNKKTEHTIQRKDVEFYVIDAQNIWSDLYDLIDGVEVYD